eukprot:CAMPEP_0197847916 /NCGR_PEP_ID=MMETSP1438-20131217/7469_1 /TAXON_ID=1461541 /ORGANISM="Pterosperma sp., Strain CCMP1384" /LENGTH=429 /DNA_ID=CAMNT_0043459989 /DNA_START=382 /DNA_END=1671 /DNA_ORIENTATION=+
MGNRQSAYVNISLSKPSYLPGEEVKGYVEVKSNEPVACSALDVHVSGRGFSKVTVQDPAEGSTIRDTVTFEEEKTFIDQSVRVATCTSGTFAPGHYQLPFTVTLPKDAPPSCHDYGDGTVNKGLFGLSYEVAASLLQESEDVTPGSLEVQSSTTSSPVLLRTVHLNVDVSPPEAPGQERVESKEDKASSLTPYGAAGAVLGLGLPVLEVLYTGQTKILKEKMSIDSGDFKFEDVTISSDQLGGNSSIQMKGTLHNKTDADRAQISITQSAQLSAKSHTAPRRQFRTVVDKSVGIREGKNEFSTTLSLPSSWTPNASTDIPGLFTLSYKVTMKAMSGYGDGVMKALLSRRPTITFPITIIRGGHMADRFDWAEGKASKVYEEPKRPGLLRRIGDGLKITRREPPPPPETRFAPAPYNPEPERYYPSAASE